MNVALNEICDISIGLGFTAALGIGVVLCAAGGVAIAAFILVVVVELILKKIGVLGAVCQFILAGRHKPKQKYAEMERRMAEKEADRIAAVQRSHDRLNLLYEYRGLLSEFVEALDNHEIGTADMFDRADTLIAKGV